MAETDRRERFLGLEGLRGVAAIAAAAYDFAQAAGASTSPPSFWSHGYLAADFFFCLSGFVLACTYGRQLAGGALGFTRFSALRLIRLLPLLAAVVLVSFLIRMTFVTSGRPVPGDTGLALLSDLPYGLLSIPHDLRVSAGGAQFPLNSCAWFIFYDVAVSAIWALLLRRPLTALEIGIGIVGLCLVVMFADGITVDTFTVSGPGSLAPWLPLARAALSFVLGATLWHVSAGRVDAVFYVEILGTLLWAVLWLPVDHSWIFDTACTLILFPTIIVFGAEAQTLVAPAIVLRILGAISFPLFALHMPIFLLLAAGTSSGTTAITPGRLAAILMVCVVAAWLIAAYVERPLRRLATRALCLRGGAADL